MINTTIGKDLQGVQGWSQLASILDADKTDSVKNATVELEKDVIQITVNDGTSTHTVTISAPDLGKVEGEPDKEALAKVAKDIESLAASLAAVGGSVTPEMSQAITKLQTDIAATVTGKVAGAGQSVKGASRTVGSSADSINTAQALFDLYALMALMVQVAQTQRDKAREIRQTENQQIQNSIQQQADDIRAAAMIALGFGIASAALSGVMSVVTMVGQARSFRQQTTAMRQLEVPAQNLEAAKLAANPKAAQARFNEMDASTKGYYGREYMAKTFKSEAKAGAKSSQQSFEALEKDFTDQIGQARRQVEEAEATEKKAGDALLKAKDDPNTTKEQLEAKTKAYEDACRETKAAKENYNRIEQGFFGKLELQAKVNEVEIAHLEEKLAAGTGDKDTGRNLNTLKLRNDYLRLYTAKMKGQYASTEKKNADLLSAQKNYDEAKGALNLDSKFTSSQQMMNRWMGVNQVSTTLSQLVGSLGNLLSERGRATATEEGVKQQQHNEQLDQIKDLFSQAETVVQAIVQLMQAVLSAENESVMKAIRA